MNELSKTFWTQIRKRIAVSAILPPVVIMLLITQMALMRSGLGIFTPKQIFFVGLGFLYFVIPLLFIKFGDDLLLKVGKPNKPTNRSRSQPRLLTEAILPKIGFNILLYLIVSAVLGFFILTTFFTIELERAHPILKYSLSFTCAATPYLACHLYFFIAEIPLSIFKTFTQIKWHSTTLSHKWERSKLFDSDNKSSIYDEPFGPGLNHQGKPDCAGDPDVGYDD